MKKNERIWSEEDRLFLEQNYKKYGAKYCAEKLDRTRYAVSKRARMIGITGRHNAWNFKKDDFIEYVKTSKTITEVLFKMKLVPAGGNFRTVKKYISLLKLDTSHFITQAEIARKINEVFVKKPIEYYLVENNTTASSSSVKERLYKEGLKERKCELCGQGEIWRGAKMSLIIDHKNGDRYDYRLENLQIVCPNCASTLPTHCRKNKRN
jgi:predicted RNA-binding Zn-ribbon protein involved in translation (DUF1610 family)